MKTCSRTLGLLLVGGLLWAMPVRAEAQDLDAVGDEAANGALNDLFVILINGPVYLSSRLPMMMATQPPDASFVEGEFGKLSLGVGLKSDIYGQFQDVTFGANNIMDIYERTPDVVPLPSLSLYGRMGLTEDLDVSAHMDFIPSIQQTAQGIDLLANYYVVGGQGRYKVLNGHGGTPSVTLGSGLSVFSGRLEIGKELHDSFDKTVDDPITGQGVDVTGSFNLSGAPVLEWFLTQIQLDAKAAWAFDWFQPYVGFGVDFTYGKITSSLEGSMSLQIDEVGGQGFGSGPLVKNDADFSSSLAEEVPTFAALHPVGGLQFQLSESFHITLQGDVHLPFQQQATKQDEQVDEFFTVDGKRNDNFYYIRYRDSTSLFRNPVFGAALGLRYDI